MDKKSNFLKLQIHFGGDSHEIMVTSKNEPKVVDLVSVLEQRLSVHRDDQKVYFRGQELHPHKDRTLQSFGVCNLSSVTLAGRKSRIESNYSHN